MTIAILQALLTIAACYGLWRSWRALDRGSRGGSRASHIITAGFLIRAFGAQILFWISWLRLPIARSLQLGDGFWFFALDGTWYLTYARDLLSHGAKAILFVGGNYPARIFLQWFAIFAGAFGDVASTGILFNCFLYLATCALILRLARHAGERARDCALAAIAFGPASILWSLQLLKDTFFVFLIVAMVVLWSEWQRLWRGEVLHRLSIAICAGAMWYAVYAISGTRWYVGGIVAAVSFLFLGLVANLPRLAGSLIALLLFVTLGQAFLLGGDFDVPLPVRAALDVRALFQPRAETERAKVVLTTARRGFQTSLGGTMIKPGPALLVQPAPKPVPQPRKEKVAPSPAAPLEPPQSLAAKIATGAAAMFVPRIAAQAAGLVRIGGGRGFWLFADLDTLIFDLVVFGALAFCVRGIVRRERRVTPLFLFVVLVFGGLTLPMIYSVTNFGTLFRLRVMIYVLAAVLPLTLDLRTPAPAPAESR